MGTADDIARLREGSMIDYDMETWEVTDYDTYDDAGWPADVWTLESGTDVLFLEHDYDDGDVFRLSKPAKISEIMAEDNLGQRRPFLTAIRDSPDSMLGAPSTILYQHEEYVLAEEDARVDAVGVPTQQDELTRSERDSVLMGVCGGYAEHNGVSSTYVRLGVIALTLATNFFVPCVLMPVALGAYFLAGIVMPKTSTSGSPSGLTHYWVYQKGNEFVALECMGANDWDAYTGREVEPYEFNNILPGRSD